MSITIAMIIMLIMILIQVVTVHTSSSDDIEDNENVTAYNTGLIDNVILLIIDNLLN